MAARREDVEQRLDWLNRMLRAHAGNLELIGLSSDGVVSVRFAGMCRGCELRPITMAATIRPALLAVAGVTRVELIGARISEEAEQRIVDGLDAHTLERWTSGAVFGAAAARSAMSEEFAATPPGARSISPTGEVPA